MVFLAVLTAMTFVASGSALAQDTLHRRSDSVDYNAGIVYDYNFAYYLKAAKGWRMDDSLAAASGWSTAFYPESLTAATSPIVVFPVVYFKDDTNMTLHDVMSAYGQKFEADHRGSHISDEPPITARNGSIAQVCRFTNDAANDYQMIAFFDVPKGVIAIILSSRSSREFDRYVDGFHEIVSSYVFITDKARIQYGKDSIQSK